MPRVDTAIDCGFAVNPERIRSQVEGAAVMGMSLAMYSEVSFKNGRAEQSNFDTYELARIDNTPLDVRRTSSARLRHAGQRCRRAGRCRRSRRPWPTRSSPPPASASAALPIAKHDLKSI